MGITMATLSTYRKTPVTVEDVKNLTRKEAIAIYYKNYWAKPRLDTISTFNNLSVAVFNQGVLRGPITAVKTLQKVVGAVQDGSLGGTTVNRINSYGEMTTLREFLQACEHAYVDVVIKRPTSIKYLRGWLNRVHELWDLLL